MIKSTFVFGILAVFLFGCSIMGNDSPTSPRISVAPSTIEVGQKIEISIRPTSETRIPYCSGFVYTIERLESDGWQFFDADFRACTGLFPEYIITRPITIKHTITEAGTFRFVSSYRFNTDERYKPLYSKKFLVELQR